MFWIVFAVVILAVVLIGIAADRKVARSKTNLKSTTGKGSEESNQRHARIESIVREAMEVFQRYDSLVSDDVHAKINHRIADRTKELEDASEAAPAGMTWFRLGAIMSAIAQEMGFMVWEYWGHRLSEEECISLAHANATLELYFHLRKIPAGNTTREFYEQAIINHALSKQSGMPVAICFMGQEELAHQMVTATIAAAKLPTDEEIQQAIDRIDVEQKSGK